MSNKDLKTAFLFMSVENKRLIDRVINDHGFDEQTMIDEVNYNYSKIDKLDELSTDWLVDRLVQSVLDNNFLQGANGRFKAELPDEAEQND